MSPEDLHFLVVDDQPITRLIVTTLLRGLGYTTVSEAEDGQKALSMLQTGCSCGKAVNFVITDWNMPTMDGLVLVRTVRASAELQQLPVLMVTSNAKVDQVNIAVKAGSDGFIDKQFLSLEVLKEGIEKILMREDRKTWIKN